LQFVHVGLQLGVYLQLVCVQLQQSQIRCNYFRRVAISVVSQLQSVTLFVAIGSRSIGSR
jgi:hypothetical protein